MDTTRDLQLPSGWEVESAALHPPTESVSSSGVTTPERSGFRGTLDSWKSRGLSKVHDIQRVVSDRCETSLTAARGSVRDGANSVRNGAKTQLTKVQSSMRTSPMLWTGIAAGTGFGLGLIGRIAHWRNRSRRVMPDLVIIESTC